MPEDTQDTTRVRARVVVKSVTADPRDEYFAEVTAENDSTQVLFRTQARTAPRPHQIVQITFEWAGGS